MWTIPTRFPDPEARGAAAPSATGERTWARDTRPGRATGPGATVLDEARGAAPARRGGAP
jgi:hypothetical protein